MEQDDPSPERIVITQSSIYKTLLLLVTLFVSVSLFINLKSPEDIRNKVKTLRTTDLVQASEAPTFSFVIEDIEKIEFQRVLTLQEQRRQLWSSATPALIEQTITEQCAAVGCDATQVIRVMYCESKANTYATNGRYQGLFQHDVYYWDMRASKYGVPGTSIFDPYAQIHVSTRMFAEGFSYLWQCK